MFDISFAELALIFLIALVILGPERLPKVARSVGYWAGRARQAFHHLKTELEREAFNQEMQDKFKTQRKDMGLDEEPLQQEHLKELRELQQSDVLPPHKPNANDGDAEKPADQDDKDKPQP